MNQFEMVAIIVVAVMIASVIRAKYSSNRRCGGDSESVPRDNAENVRLREEVKELKERLKVLERITVEKENSLTREIESLRDR
jgi:cell division protein FtsL